MESIGWIGSLAFTVCAVPQAYKSYKDGDAHGLSIYYLMLWLTGEIFTIIYVVPQGNAPLIFNYVGNLIVLLIILRYKFFPRKNEISAQDIMKQDYVDKQRHISSITEEEFKQVLSPID